MHTCSHMIYPCFFVCVRDLMRACVFACKCVCMCACMHGCVLALTCIPGHWVSGPESLSPALLARCRCSLRPPPTLTQPHNITSIKNHNSSSPHNHRSPFLSAGTRSMGRWALIGGSASHLCSPPCWRYIRGARHSSPCCWAWCSTICTQSRPQAPYQRDISHNLASRWELRQRVGKTQEESWKYFYGNRTMVQWLLMQIPTRTSNWLGPQITHLYCILHFIECFNLKLWIYW